MRTLYGIIRDKEDEIKYLNRKLEFGNSFSIRAKIRCLEKDLDKQKIEWYCSTGERWEDRKKETPPPPNKVNKKKKGKKK